MLALAVEHTGAHRRIALRVLLALGQSPRRLVLGFAATTAFISMWISNAAAALILMPVAVAVVDHAHAVAGDRARTFGVAVMLAVAYGASVGGLGTPIGTAPNLVAIGALQANFPGGPALSFLGWATIGVPIAVLLTLVMWALLVRVSPGVPADLDLGARAVIGEEVKQLGAWRPSERRSLALFAIAALLWITREDAASIPGWSTLLGLGTSPDDGTVALLLVVVAFLLPSGEAPGARILTWPIAAKAPWDLFVLFGGGIALAVGFDRSGISRWIGEAFTALGGGSMAMLTAGTALAAIFVTELISNTALASIAMPILAAAAKQMGGDPRLLLVPVAMACSCGFMMPAGTGPNAIAFGTGRVRIAEMVRAGLLVNLAAWLVIVAMMLIRFG